MSGRYFDFDAALREAAGEPIVIHYQGRDWDLPSSIPAKVVLRIVAMREQEGDLDQGAMLEIMTGVVPNDTLQQWLDGDMTIDQMATLIKQILSMYRIGGEDAEGEAQSPETTGPSASSNSGQS